MQIASPLLRIVLPFFGLSGLDQFLHMAINGTIFGGGGGGIFERKKFLNVKHAFYLFLRILSETLLTPRRFHRSITTKVRNLHMK
jgi:hypothetical protein